MPTDGLLSLLLSIFSCSIALLGLFGVATTFLMNLITRYIERPRSSKEMLKLIYSLVSHFRVIETMGFLLYSSSILSGTGYLIRAEILSSSETDAIALMSVILMYCMFVAILYALVFFLRAFKSTLRSLGEM